jgi:hypothetical protein
MALILSRFIGDYLMGLKTVMRGTTDAKRSCMLRIVRNSSLVYDGL